MVKKQNGIGQSVNGLCDESSVNRSRLHYVAPQIMWCRFEQQTTVLAGSPPVGSNVEIEPPVEDEDEELFGAKWNNLWSDPSDEAAPFGWEP